MPPPTGIVHLWPPGASQLAVIAGAVESAHPLPKLKFTKYCHRKRLVLGSPLASVSGDSWLNNEPRTNGPGVARTTRSPPAAQVPVFAGDARRFQRPQRENAAPRRQLEPPEAGPRNCQLVMDGCHDQASSAQMLLYKVTDKGLPLYVKVRRRLVKKPQGCGHQHQAGQRGAPLLARGERPDRAITPMVCPRPLERRVDF